MAKIFFTKQVRSEDIEKYIELNWYIAHPEKLTHHDVYGVLMRYDGDQDPPPMPVQDE